MYRKFLILIVVTLALTVQGYSLVNPTIEEIFTEEHNNPLSLGDDTRAKDILPFFLQSIQKNYDIKKIVDAGCGKVTWLHSAFPYFDDLDYLGFDIVEPVIKVNKDQFENEKINFVKLDMTQEFIPPGDLIVCRNCLEWFSYYDIYATLEKLKASNCTYLVASTIPALLENRETSTGMNREINLVSAPFYFPPPLELVEEESDSKRYLGLWRLEDIDLSAFYQKIFPPLTILSKCVGHALKWEHAGVMNSLRRGLPRVHRDFNINTDDYNSVKANVVVVADLNAGLQAYQWKENKRIETLMVGPNIVGYPEEANSFISWPLVDAFLSPSEWPVQNFIRFIPSLQGRTRIWFAGVDETSWKPSLKFPQKDDKKVLVYRKSNPEVCNQVENILRAHGFSVFSVSYGSYSQEQYKILLAQCKFAVFISSSESQGIALAEAWSMDVPTLVWNPKGSIHYAGHEYQNITSSPYLNSMVGSEWRTWDEFNSLLVNFEINSSLYQPRRWVLLNMTDKISAQTLIGLVREMNTKNK